MLRWTSVWGQAHTDISNMSPKYNDSTMRISVRTVVSGTVIRIRLSNRDGKAGYKVLEAAAMNQHGESVSLHFQGVGSCEMPPGVEFFSDPAELTVNGGELITISLAFAGKASSGNNISEHILSSKKGNFVTAAQFATAHRSLTSCLFDVAPAIPALSAVEVLTEERKEVVVCFGDSITQQSRWTKPLASKLCDSAIIINKGIGGNRLLAGPPSKMFCVYGRSGIERFERDVLEETGVTSVVLSIGTNDIGMMKNETDVKTYGAEALAYAFSTLTDRARKRGLKVFATTILPRMGSNGYSSFQEKQRIIFNDWVRQSDLFDAVVDFDAALRDSIHPDMMAFPFDSGDHLHPSDLGGAEMGECAAKAGGL